MKEAMNSVINLNPDYIYKYFDDEDMENFYIANFGRNSHEYRTHKQLRDGSFKSDFWRYSILYLFGKNF